MKKLILWESSCWNISPEIITVWLIDSDEELLAAKSNWFAVKRIFSGRRFTGCLPFIKVGQSGVFRNIDIDIDNCVSHSFIYRKDHSRT